VDVLLVPLAAGVEHLAAAVERRQALSDAHGQEAEGGLFQSDGLLARGTELQIEIHQPEPVAGMVNRQAALLVKQIRLAVTPARADHKPAEDRAVLQQDDLLVQDQATAVRPEVVTGHLVVSNPQRVVMPMAAGAIVGFAELRQRDAVRTVDGIEEGATNDRRTRLC